MLQIQESQSEESYPEGCTEYKENGSIRLSTLDNKPIRDLVNGSKLKVYEERNKRTNNYFISTEGKKDQIRKAKRLRRKC